MSKVIPGPPGSGGVSPGWTTKGPHHPALWGRVGRCDGGNTDLLGVDLNCRQSWQPRALAGFHSTRTRRRAGKSEQIGFATFARLPTGKSPGQQTVQVMMACNRRIIGSSPLAPTESGTVGASIDDGWWGAPGRRLDLSPAFL